MRNDTNGDDGPFDAACSGLAPITIADLSVRNSRHNGGSLEWTFRTRSKRI